MHLTLENDFKFFEPIMFPKISQKLINSSKYPDPLTKLLWLYELRKHRKLYLLYIL